MTRCKAITRLIVAIVLLSASLPLWAAVNATLSRSQVYEGDTVVLDIETDSQTSATPDLNGLKRDFDVLSNSQSHQVSIINGRRLEKRGWKVTLKPKRLGRLTIPAIAVGGDKTQPLTLVVEEVPPEVAQQIAEHLFVETELEPVGHGPYVQQQLRLRVRLYYDIDLLEGELSNPAPNGDVVLERLGEDRHYTTTRAGKRYNVIERMYALFPQRSGTLRIPSVTFEGRAASTGGQSNTPRGRSLMQRFFNSQGIPDPFANDPFFSHDPFADNFFTGTPLGDPGRRVSVRSKPVTLKVKPRPQDFHGKHWLPAVDLKISDGWAESPPQFRVGEPVTRTLIIEAKGLESSQLPQIETPSIQGMQVYPEQPLNDDRVIGGWILGRSEQSFAFVPSQAGRQVVPEVRLRWWDVNADKEREVVLPPWEIDVQPGAGGVVSPAPKVAPPLASTQEQKKRVSSAPVSAGYSLYWSRWLWAWLVLCGALLIGALVWRWRRRSDQGFPATGRHDDSTARQQGADNSAALKELRKACEANDPRAAAHALLGLACIEWPLDPPLDLTQLASRLAKGRDEIADLNHVLFAPHKAGQWDGRAFCERFGKGLTPLKIQSSSKGMSSTMPLPPLYPQHTGGA